LIAVARTRDGVWRHLVQRHAWGPGVDVILDRRVPPGIGKMLAEDGFVLIPR
jgi:hypothetical protein